ncbi:MAG: c-type cytochrome [Leptothrix ochracea]|uniref:c-type cytochrome n=1 Tax=Leptothrix ochracea TaxID=735331 RepID=UPI0034E2128C
MKALLVIAAAAAVVSAPAFADAGLDMAKAKGCLACHSVDKKVVGPAYKDVAAKYSAADTDKLTQKVLNGGSGSWGAVPMPANKAKVSEAEAKQLVTWVLSQKK